MGLFSKKNKIDIPWNIIKNENDIDIILEKSQEKHQVIFKHSTRCSISNMALHRFERNWNDEYTSIMDLHFLDLIEHRNVSNLIAEKTEVVHESPQTILLRSGTVKLVETHNGISIQRIVEIINQEK